MDSNTRHRVRFRAVLVLYVVWILALGILGVVSSQGPPPNSQAGLPDAVSRSDLIRVGR